MSTLETLPDELLIAICDNFDIPTLINLKKTCQRFYYLLMDNRYWRDIDMMQQSYPLPLLVEALKCVNHNTKSLKVRGEIFICDLHHFKNFNITLAETFIQRVGNLSVLELRSIQIKCDVVKTALFPLTLKRLVFSGCHFIPTARVLSTIFKRLVNLEEVGIDYCPFLYESTLLKLKAKRNLRWMSLRGCSSSVFSGPEPGFNCLEYLDLSHASITNQHLWTISRLKSLKEIVLERCERAKDFLVMNSGVQCFGTASDSGKRLEKITLHHFKGVTDTSLSHLSNTHLNLVLVDVSGTSVTRSGVEAFKMAKPRCKVIAEHLRDKDDGI